MDLQQLVVSQHTASQISAIDIAVILIINICLIFVVKLVFMGLKSLEVETNYWQSIKKWSQLLGKNEISTEEKQFLKKTVNSVINFSSTIGFIERILYIIAFATRSFELLALVVGVKTLVRFPEINKGEKASLTAEQYILGTLINIVLAIIVTALVF